MVGQLRVDELADATFEILAHHRRRHVLACLQDSETPMTLVDLTNRVAVREYDAPLSGINAEDVRRVSVSLSHAHLPKLADAKYVRHDRELDSVTLVEPDGGDERIRAAIETHVAN